MKRNCIKGAISGIFLIAGFTGVAQAATVNITTSISSAYQSEHGLRSNTGSEGVDLDGALVSADYADRPSEDLVWEAQGIGWSNAGWADGEDTNLFMSWDGFDLTATSLLTSLSIDLTSASSAFDISTAYDPDPLSTLGSSFGFPFEIYSGGAALLGSIAVTYTGIVNLANSVAAGDLFTTMTIDFTGLSTGGFLGEMSFRSDIDTFEVAGDLSPVPLPASLSFLLIGLGGLGLARKRSRAI